MTINNLICPRCKSPIGFFEKPSVCLSKIGVALKNRKQKPKITCPKCDSVFQVRLSYKRAGLILPLTILIMILELKSIKSVVFMNGIAGIIVAGVFGGITAGLGIRLCRIVDERDKQDSQ
jgi:hypothetical protein